MAKIAVFAHTDTTGNQPVTLRAEVFYYRDWREYVVKFYRNGVHQEDADYFTGGNDNDHKADAIGTAKAFVFAGQKVAVAA